MGKKIKNNNQNSMQNSIKILNLIIIFALIFGLFVSGFALIGLNFNKFSTYFKLLLTWKSTSDSLSGFDDYVKQFNESFSTNENFFKAEYTLFVVGVCLAVAGLVFLILTIIKLKRKNKKTINDNLNF